MAQIVVVTSGKGGVGKSSVCVMTGLALARMGKRVLLLEMDSGLRGLDIMLGVEDQTVFDLADVLEGRCEPIKAMTRHPQAPKLALLPAPYDPLFLPDKKDLIRLTKGLSRYFDLVLVDTPAGLGASFEVCTQVADRALLVVTPDPVCVRDGARVADLLFDRGVQTVGLVINKVPTNQRTQNRILPDLDTVIDATGVPLFGVVPQEDRMHHALSTGTEPSQGLLAQRAFGNIAARLCGQYVDLAVE